MTVAQCLADPISIIHVHLSGLTISGSPVKGVVGIMSEYIKQTVLFREVAYNMMDKKLEDEHLKKKMDDLVAEIVQYMLVFYVLVILPPHCWSNLYCPDKTRKEYLYSLQLILTMTLGPELIGLVDEVCSAIPSLLTQVDLFEDLGYHIPRYVCTSLCRSQS